MKSIFFYLICSIGLWSFNSCTEGQKKTDDHVYSISGVARGIPDGTVIFLRGDNTVDSTAVTGGKFFFSGELKEPAYVKLFVDSSANAKWFWLEDSNISIGIVKGNLGAAEIEGSRLQHEEETLKKRIQLITKKRDSLISLLMDPKIEQRIKDSIFILFEDQQKKMMEEYEDFISQHPKSYLSAKVLESNMIEFGKEKTNKLFNRLSRNLRRTEAGKSISEFITLNKNPEVGEMFVDFSQMNEHDKLVKFSSARGEITLIEFWASWCKPCRTSNPALRNLYNQYADKGFQIVGVSLDTSKEQWISAIKKDSLFWTNLSDLKGSRNAVAMMYGVKAIPDNFLINREGIIIGRHLNPETLEQRLAEYYKK